LTRDEKEYHAELVPDLQYSWEDSWGTIGSPEFADDGSEQASLDDVLREIRAPEAWTRSRGANVAIASVDSGINGRRLEFAVGGRLNQISFQADAWADDDGHGTMCACIAAASRGANGEFDGVAPEASLMSIPGFVFSAGSPCATKSIPLAD
jgi:serine protease AprX